MPRGTFNLDETTVFYNVQPKRTVALKGENCQGGNRYKVSGDPVVLHC